MQAVCRQQYVTDNVFSNDASNITAFTGNELSTAVLLDFLKDFERMQFDNYRELNPAFHTPVTQTNTPDWVRTAHLSHRQIHLTGCVQHTCHTDQ